MLVQKIKMSHCQTLFVLASLRRIPLHFPINYFIWSRGIHFIFTCTRNPDKYLNKKKIDWIRRKIVFLSLLSHQDIYSTLTSCTYLLWFLRTTSKRTRNADFSEFFSSTVFCNIYHYICCIFNQLCGLV